MKIYREIILLSLVLGSIRCEFSQTYVDKILEAGSQETKRTDNDVAQTKQFTIATFNCDQTQASKQKPTSVHALRPADIELVAAIGDSLTAANGAKARSILGLLEENRGVSWSIGSEYPDVSLSITLPNILKKFNPLLYGASTGTGKVNTSVAYLNVAQPGHTSYEMWGQAYLLVARMREMPLFREYWKIVTFFVGGNDLCQSCGEESKFSVANYTKNIRETLDYFQNNLPKTLVNLVLTLDVTGIEMLPGATCRNMQSSYCSCGLSQSFRPTLNNLTASYQKSIEDLIASGRYDTKEDFTVVLQPFMKKMKPPTTVFGTPDYSYFAPDCFHLSAKGHQAAAIELWNSMLTPVGKKKELWTLNSGIKCPTENQPFIFTNKNSQ